MQVETYIGAQHRLQRTRSMQRECSRHIQLLEKYNNAKVDVSRNAVAREGADRGPHMQDELCGRWHQTVHAHSREGAGAS